MRERSSTAAMMMGSFVGGSIAAVDTVEPADEGNVGGAVG